MVKSESVAAGDAIAAAKNDFDRIKSARDAALLPDSRLPKMSVPELASPSVPSTTTVVPRSKLPLKEGKSATWLADAMAKESGARERRGRDANGRERERRGGLSNEDVASERSADPVFGTRSRVSESARQGDEPESVTAMKPANPLETFLGDWMTPQDYALLKPGLSKSFDREGSRAHQTLGPAGTSAPNGLTAFFPRSDSVNTGLSSAPRENPYLEAMRSELLVGPGSVNVNPVVAPPIARPPSASSITSAPPPPLSPAPRIPEFVKPSTDDKYFKPLKRF